MSMRTRLILVLLTILAAYTVLLADVAYGVQALAALLLCGLLPGGLLVDLAVGRSAAPPTRAERAALAIGMGYVALVFGMLLLSYLPGPLDTWQVHAGYGALAAVLLALIWHRDRVREHPPGRVIGDGIEADFPARPTVMRTVAAVALVIVLGSLLRLGNAGYAEFHGDEARAVLRAAATIQGYEDVLFLHKKGPAEILLPAAEFALAGRVTEATARLPYALAGMTALLAVYLLGRRMFGPLAGWAAAILLAVDGYAVAFARIVQYQSVVILTAALVVLILYRLLRRPQAAGGYLSLAAALAATGLLAHYEAVYVFVPGAFLLALLLRRYPYLRGELARSALWAGALGAALTALFYAPYVRHPQFGATFTYLAERRVGGGDLPYNNLADFFNRTTLYNSTYYVLFLIAAAVLALFAAYRRGAGRGWGGVMAAALAVGLGLVVWRPAWLTMAGIDLTFAVFVIAIGLAWALPRQSVEERTLWLWFGVPFLITLFLLEKPRTHVYVFFTPWALIAGMAVERTWLALRQRANPHVAQVTGAAAAAGLIGVFGAYTFWYFVYTDVEILRTWQENRPAGYWTVYDVPDNRALFGFPLANGWKATGRLIADGAIAGKYATNEVELWAPYWYTRGAWRCEDRAEWFFRISNPQPDPDGYARAIDEYLAKDYARWGAVTIAGDRRMAIYRRSQEPFDVQTFALEQYAAAFDAAATPDLPLSYPVVEPPIGHPLDVNLGDLIRLEGYDLAFTPPLEPGETFTLTLYWRAQRPIDGSYKVFNQSFYGEGTMVAQQDGFPVCGMRGTWLWDPGELIVDIHEITVRPDAPPGLYPLFTGLYIQETGERLDVLDEAGNAVGDRIHLTDIRIGAE